MKYIKEFNEYEPDQESVLEWEKYLDQNYQIEDFRGDKLIVIDDKPLYITGSLFNKGRLTDKIFNDISYKEGLEIHEPSLRRAIKNWIDGHSEINESLSSDLDFAIVKIKEHFSQDDVNQRFEQEILEWVDDNWQDDYDSEEEWYEDHNNGEAQDSVINQMIGWYQKAYNKQLSNQEHLELVDAIKSEYECLNY